MIYKTSETAECRKTPPNNASGAPVSDCRRPVAVT